MVSSQARDLVSSASESTTITTVSNSRTSPHFHVRSFERVALTPTRLLDLGRGRPSIRCDIRAQCTAMDNDQPALDLSSALTTVTGCETG